MSKSSFTFMLLASLVTASSAALARPDQPVSWDRAAQAADQAYWDAYNQVDPDKMNRWLTSDVEFDHDRGGKLHGKKALSDANNVMRTATISETLYRAIVTGEHRFFARPKGEPEALVGHANFSHLMVLQGKQWRIARIFSFEHVDAAGSGK